MEGLEGWKRSLPAGGLIAQAQSLKWDIQPTRSGIVVQTEARQRELQANKIGTLTRLSALRAAMTAAAAPEAAQGAGAAALPWCEACVLTYCSHLDVHLVASVFARNLEHFPWCKAMSLECQPRVPAYMVFQCFCLCDTDRSVSSNTGRLHSRLGDFAHIHD